MANINQPTLILFENIRKEMGYIPPANSNEMFRVGDGTIVLQTIRDDINNYRFDLRIQNRSVNTGNGEFYISGEHGDASKPYRQMYINKDAKFIINDKINISNLNNSLINPIIINDGTLEFSNNSIITITAGAEIIINNSGILNVGDNVKINIDPNSSMKISGTINISYSSVNSLLGISNIIIDNSAIINITGLPTNRPYSITDYITDLRKRYQNVNTIGSKYISTASRITYYWKAGDISQPSDVLSLVVETGTAILGDFNLSLVGLPQYTEPFMQTLSDLTINKLASLLISDTFMGSSYINPTLFISQIPGNTSRLGFCNVEGNVIVDGHLSAIQVDRGGYLRIRESGIVTLKNNGKILNTNNLDSVSLYIYGKLIIDDISQLQGFISRNIEFGPNGKLIILNTNETGIKKVLFSTPLGILSSELYQLFKDRLNKIEYHIHYNDGIKIDQYDNGYNLSNWYGGMRLEKAVKLGYVIWHDGAFIELDKSVIPWIDDNPTLLKIGNLFNVFGDTDKEKLQNTINRLIYAGFNSIIFRFITNTTIKDITLTLDGCYIKTAFYNTNDKKYQLSSNNPGTIFIRNNLNSANIDELINSSSKVVNISNPQKTEFSL